MIRFLIEMIEGDFVDRFEIKASYNYRNKIKFDFFDGCLLCECIDEYRFKDGKLVKKLIDKRYELVRENCFYVAIMLIYRLDKPLVKKVIFYDRLFIGNHKKADVHSAFMADNEMFFIKDGKILANFSDIYVNGVKDKQAILCNYDEITFRMIKIIYHRQFFLITGSELIFSSVSKNRPARRVIENKTVAKKRDEEIVKPDLKYEIKIEDFKENSGYSLAAGIIQSLIMTAGMLLVAGINFYSGILSGRSFIELLPVMIMPLVMLFSTISMPIINAKINKNNRKKHLAAYEKRAAAVIDRFEKQIDNDIEELKQYLELGNNDESTITAAVNSRQLYYLHFSKPFFSFLNFGEGEIINELQVDKQFTDTTEKIKKRIEDIIERYRVMHKVPLDISLISYRLIKLDISPSDTVSVIKEWILKIAYSHDYHQMKIALDMDDKLIQDRKIMEVKHLFYQKKRLLISDISELKKIKDCHIVYFSQKPPEYSAIDKNITCVIYGQSFNDMCNEDFFIDYRSLSYRNYQRKDKGSFNYIPFRQTDDLIDKMKDVVIKENHFYNGGFDLFDVYGTKVKLYQNDSRKGSIEAVFGYDGNGRLITYDISEYGIGPHAMIGGSTGSGKTSFLIGLLLSVCLRYTAQEVAIALIDYKGSGIADSLSDGNRPLRHIVLSLTNIEPIAFDRSIAAFKLECERREKLFAELSRLTSRSVTHLKDYQSYWRKEFNLERLPVLLIVIDEFAELKNYRPDFMKNIISIARIGRSLGIQLILATQNPSSAIDEDIKANISYRIALKMLNRHDAIDLTGSDAASKIKRPGEFYLSFGGEMIHGFSIDIRKHADPKEGAKVCLYDNILNIKKETVFHTANDQLQLAYLINKINSIDISAPLLAYQKELKPKTYCQLFSQYRESIGNGDILLGEYDDYEAMEVGPLIHSEVKDGGMIVLSADKTEMTDFIFLLALSLSNRKVLIVGDRNKEYPQGAEIIADDDYNDIFFVLKELKTKTGAVLIISEMEKIQEGDDRKYFLESMLIELINRGILVIVFYRNIASLSNVMLNKIKTHYYLGNIEKDEAITFFGSYNRHSQSAVCFIHDHLVGFRIPVFNRSEVAIRSFFPVLRHIPGRIDPEEHRDKLFLGYSKQRRSKVYLVKGKTILFTSFYDEYLTAMRGIYCNFDNIDFINVNDIDRKKYYAYIIWCGPGIRNQFLFVARQTEELEDDEVYLYDHSDDSEVVCCVG